MQAKPGFPTVHVTQEVQDRVDYLDTNGDGTSDLIGYDTANAITAVGPIGNSVFGTIFLFSR